MSEAGNRIGNRAVAVPAEAEPASARPDEEVVAEILAGQVDRFELLVRRHQRPLINFLYRMIGNSDQAAELTQEVFTRAFLALERFDPRWRFTTWLYRIGSNCAIDYLRRQKHVPVSLDDPLPGQTEGLTSRIASPGVSPVDRLVRDETSRRLARAIGALPAPARNLILLRHSQHLSYDEIATVTGLPLGTVKNRIFRARLALRRLLDEPEAPARRGPGVRPATAGSPPAPARLPLPPPRRLAPPPARSSG